MRGCKICGDEKPCCDSPDLQAPDHPDNCPAKGREDRECLCDENWCEECVNCGAYCECEV